MIQGCHYFCWPFLPTGMHSLPWSLIVRGDGSGKNCVWKICCLTWCSDQRIPHRQRLDCWQCIHSPLQMKLPTHQLLQCNRPFSKCNCQEGHKRPSQPSMEAIASCKELVARAIHLAPWLFALQIAVHLYSTLPTQDENWLRLEKFTSINVDAGLTNNHTFGCPAYVLQNALQRGFTIPKRNPCCWLWVNLGPSPFYGCNMYLVINPSTVLVSPQYHVIFDGFFDAIQ